MEKEETTKLLKEAVSMWGTDAQLWMLVEEAGELIKAVAKMHRASMDRRDAILGFIDELVDVQVMIDQWRLEVGEERFNRAYDLKMKRLAAKLDVYREAHRTNPHLEKAAHIDLSDFM